MPMGQVGTFLQRQGIKQSFWQGGGVTVSSRKDRVAWEELQEMASEESSQEFQGTLRRWLT